MSGNPTSTTTRRIGKGRCPKCDGKGQKKSSKNGGVCPTHETKCDNHDGKYCYVTDNGCNMCKLDEQGRT